MQGSYTVLFGILNNAFSKRNTISIGILPKKPSLGTVMTKNYPMLSFSKKDFSLSPEYSIITILDLRPQARDESAFFLLYLPTVYPFYNRSFAMD